MSGEIGRPSAQLRPCWKLAAVNIFSPIGARRTPTRQRAGEARSASCDRHGAKSDESATKCERMSPKEKT